ncbi:MAG: Maf family protein [Acidiferrobacterales bacterium]|nr:Maf family protein [Acidiferrobacterales bacterium]
MISKDKRLRLVLASSSAARHAVLSKLKLDFETLAPSIDETRLAQEPPVDLVKRLSWQKAKSVSDRFDRHLIIGSDQVAVVDGEVTGKPADRDDAIRQLKRASGRNVTLYTGLALFNSESDRLQVDVLPYRVRFRELTESMILHYIDKDQPFDCGGSLRSEGLGVALLEEFDGNDPNILLGLPLIRLIDMLAVEHVHPL